VNLVGLPIGYSMTVCQNRFSLLVELSASACVDGWPALAGKPDVLQDQVGVAFTDTQLP